MLADLDLVDNVFVGKKLADVFLSFEKCIAKRRDISGGALAVCGILIR